MRVALPDRGTLMNPVSLRLALAAVATLALGACASMSRHAEVTPAPTSQPSAAPETAEPLAQYIPEREADEVERMRRAPPPATPTIETGRNYEADVDRLGMAGYVRIGHGIYHGDEAWVHAAVARHAAEAGAEQVLVYPPLALVDAGANTPGADAWGAIYYVRYKLAFGATFRDLHEEERAALGGKGGVEIGSVMGGTPAARANLMAGDYVIALNERPLADKAQFAEALRANAGRSITLTIVRAGETSQRIVRLGEAPAAGGPQP